MVLCKPKNQVRFYFLTKILIVDKNFDCWQKFWFLAKFDFWQKFWLLTKILILDKNFDFWQKFWFFIKILIFHKNFDFSQKFWFFTKMLIFDKNFDIWQTFWFVTNILIFEKIKIDFGRLLDKISFFWQNINFWTRFWFSVRIPKIPVTISACYWAEWRLWSIFCYTIAGRISTWRIFCIFIGCFPAAGYGKNIIPKTRVAEFWRNNFMLQFEWVATRWVEITHRACDNGWKRHPQEETHRKYWID